MYTQKHYTHVQYFIYSTVSPPFYSILWSLREGKCLVSSLAMYYSDSWVYYRVWRINDNNRGWATTPLSWRSGRCSPCSGNWGCRGVGALLRLRGVCLLALTVSMCFLRQTISTSTRSLRFLPQLLSGCNAWLCRCLTVVHSSSPTDLTHMWGLSLMS